jgi:BolA protein
MSRSQRMHDALFSALTPDLITIENESNRHHVPENSETHFKIVIVSAAFHGLTRVARHRLVNTKLNNEFKMGLHALSLHLYSPNEWQQHSKQLTLSPPCLDGFNKTLKKG